MLDLGVGAGGRSWVLDSNDVGGFSQIIEVARPPASVGVPLEEVALRGEGEILPRVGVAVSRVIDEDGFESAGGRWLVETIGLVAELLGSKGSASWVTIKDSTAGCTGISCASSDPSPTSIGPSGPSVGSEVSPTEGGVKEDAELIELGVKCTVE